MTVKKRTQVVMLPTNEKANICTHKILNKLFRTDLLISDLEYRNESKEFKESYSFQHLYFLSDEPIKEGDWMCNIEREPSIIQCIGKGSLRGWKKIIATTKSALDIYWRDHKNDLHGNNLPQPSQDFIKVFVEEYNKGNVTEWVDVEYEEMIFTNAFESDLSLTVNGLQDTVLTKLKVSSKNEITIRKIKESWTREEILQDIEIAMIQGLDIGQYRDKWIS